MSRQTNDKVSISSISVSNLGTEKAKYDPYVLFSYKGQKKKTSIQKGQNSPIWNEVIDIEIKDINSCKEGVIEVHLKSDKIGIDKLLGKGFISLKKLLIEDQIKLEVELVDGQNKKLESKLNLEISKKIFNDKSKVESESRLSLGDTTQSNSPRADKVRSKKPQDFQVRIKIFKGRQLEGNNIHPRCIVKFFKETKYTKTLKATNSPFWDEVFFFNLQTSEMDLGNELIELDIQNYYGYSRYETIGSFKLNALFVYDEPQHSIIHKWLLLSDLEDSLAGPKGYLNVSINVLGPGDEVPQNSKKINEDIESNLLKPAGVVLRPAVFNIKVYQAEDLPTMDSAIFQGVKKLFSANDEKKDLVDPYVELSFAGLKVQSKICYNVTKPSWNQLLKINFKFPSMCETIQIAVKDWDRTSEDDYVGTIDLPISLISDLQADGFLPNFGPCFLSMYGSPREFSEIPSCLEELDLGTEMGEGVAYRGRILVEVQTVLNERSGEIPIGDIKHTDVLKLGPILNRKKFKLHAAFHDATMLSVIDKPVQFEVSIGNYGNILDPGSASSSSSATKACSPVFDGCSYYFLPWMSSKPRIGVQSYWEDIDFRYQAINKLRKLKQFTLSTAKHLKDKIAMLGEYTSINTMEMNQMAASVLTSIETIKTRASVPLPIPSSSNPHWNDLDKKRHEMRSKKLKEIVTKCRQLPNMELKYVIEELETFASALEKLEHEPQNCIPDIIIWMICGSERIAYYRIPAYQVFYSENDEYRGEFCNILQTTILKWPGRIAKENGKQFKIPARIRFKLWFGAENDESNWLESHFGDSKSGILVTYAETYENQSFSLTSQRWGYDGLSRPKFSDLTGTLALDKENFQLPQGWEWKEDWSIDPELSSTFDNDSGRSIFMEEVYEQNHRYLPGSNWVDGHGDRKPFLWADYKNDISVVKEEFQLPKNWKWDDEWQVDINRAVDPEGWEYCLEPSMGGWSHMEKVYHVNRRRRWVRNRSLIKTHKKTASSGTDTKSESEYWEYSGVFSNKFHSKEQASDTVRRRRWHRPMQAKNINIDLAGTFLIKSNEPTLATIHFGSKPLRIESPKMVLKYKESRKYQLRAYIYQARSLIAADTSTSSSDPYLVVQFVNQSMKTEVIYKNLSPTWDQTLIFDSVEIFGDLVEIENNPPSIMVEVYDKDNSGEPDFLGRVSVKPVITRVDNHHLENTKLKWFQLKRLGEDSGEILAHFELYLIDEKKPKNLLPYPPKVGVIYRLPSEIRPKLQRTIIEILAWGVRNMTKFQLSDVNRPQIIFECGGHILESEIIKNCKKNPNSTNPVLYYDVMLPTEETYIPPISITIIDHRNFGRKPIVGQHVIKSLKPYKVDRKKEGFLISRSNSSLKGTSPSVVLQLESDDYSDKDIEEPSAKDKNDLRRNLKKVFRKHGLKRKSKFKKLSKAFGTSVFEQELIEEDIDWWCKYYASMGSKKMCGSYLRKGYSKLVIFNEELERLSQFDHLTDFCQTFKIQRGKQPIEEEYKSAGEIKANFKMYTVPENSVDIKNNMIFKNVQPIEKEDCIIRVYVIKGIDLQPQDANGKNDPFIEVECGKVKKDSRNNYIPNTNNPEFGMMFELKVSIPLEKDLCVRVKDYDLMSGDDLIGETWIDIENRILSKHRATCGLPQQYNETGVNAWRDSLKPSKILSNLCGYRNLSCILPKSGETVLKLEDKIFTLDQFEPVEIDPNQNPHLGPANERLCLHVLNEFNLVPEHIETRKLYNSSQQGIEQGRLQMWVEIFPSSLGPPRTEVDITPRKAKKFVLRCVVWNTSEVPCDDLSITGERMSDIYLKGWLQGLENDKQETDIHYRSMDGDGNFNWRYTFDFDYLPSERRILVKKKDHFWSMDSSEDKVPPVLTIQIWDNDKFSADDFIGQMSLDLNKMVKPAKTAEKCGLHQLPDIEPSDKSKTNNPLQKQKSPKFISLFNQKRVKGWWPCVMESEDGEHEMAGKCELEFEILTEEEALCKPAGRGREAPNENPRLEPPSRPETSFAVLTSPLKTFKYIVWGKNKWKFMTLLFIIFLILFGILSLYTFPGAMWNHILP